MHFSPASRGTSPQQRKNRRRNHEEAGIIVMLIWGRQIRTTTDMLIKSDRSRKRRPRRSWRFKWNKYIDKFIGELLKHLNCPCSFLQLESNGDFLLSLDRVCSKLIILSSLTAQGILSLFQKSRRKTKKMKPTKEALQV